MTSTNATTTTTTSTFTKAFRLVYRYTYSHFAEMGFPSFEAADRYNRAHHVKDPEFGTECWVEEYFGTPTRDEDGNSLEAPVECY